MNPVVDERGSALTSLGLVAVFTVSLLVPSLWWLRAATGSVLLIFVLGHSLRGLGRELVGSGGQTRLWTTAGVILDLLMSLAVLVFVGGFLMVTFLLWESVLVGTVVAIIAGSSILTLIATHKRARPSLPLRPLNPQLAFAMALVTAVAAATFVLLRSDVPFPAVTGWDLHATLATAGWAIERHGFEYLLIPPFPSSALLPYPASFVQLVVGYSVILGVPPWSIFYAAPLVLLVAYLIAAFGIAFRWSGRVLPSLLPPIALLALGVANPNTVRTPIFLTIDMVAQLIFLAILGFYLYDEGHVRRRRLLVLAAFVFLVYFYYYELIVATPFIILMLAETSTRDRGPKRTAWFVGSLLFTTAVLTIGYVALVILSPASAADLYAFLPLDQKIGILTSIYSPAVLTLVAVAWIRFRRSTPYEVKGVHMGHLFQYSAALFLIYLLPIWATYRVEFYFRWSLAIPLALIPLPSWRQLGNASTAVRNRLALRKPISRDHFETISRTLGIVILIGLLVSPIPGFLRTPVAMTSVDEYEAAAWIRDHTSPGSYIVTDPGTGFIVRGLSLRNASTFFLLSDGRAPAESSTLYPNLLASLHRVFTSNSPGQARDRILGLGFSDIFVVISTRTIAWSEVGPEALFFWPLADEDPATLLPVFREPTFSIVFASQTVYVLRFRP